MLVTPHTLTVCATWLRRGGACLLLLVMTTVQASTAERLHAVTQQWLRTLPQGMHTSLLVVGLRNGRTLAEHHPEDFLVPASVEKLVTASTAVWLLGPQHRFTTAWRTDGQLDHHGTLHGNLYLELSGDPTLTLADLDALVHALSARGVRQVTGRWLIDDAALGADAYAPGWSWDDLIQGYVTPITATVLIGHPNLVLPKAHQRWHRLTEHVQRCLKHDHITLHHPHPNQGNTPPEATTLAAHTSQTVATLVHTMLKRSDNLIADVLFKHMGQRASEPNHHLWATASRKVRRTVWEHTGMHLLGVKDGSGGSRYDVLSARQVVTLLRTMAQDPTLRQVVKGLPVAGQDGTLHHRLRNLPRRVLAKTGTMTGVSTLAGYLLAPNQQVLVFAVMNNGGPGHRHDLRDRQDALLAAWYHVMSQRRGSHHGRTSPRR